MSAVSEFILRMNDQVSGNASLAAAALGRLDQRIVSEKESLGGLNDKIIETTRSLQLMQVGNDNGKLDDKIAKTKGVLEGLQRKLQERQGGIAALEGAKPGLEAAGASAETLGNKMNGMLESMQGANGATGKLTAALKSLGPEGAAVAAVLTAVIAVTTVLISKFLDLAAACISISQEKDALANTFEALSTGKESGLELVDALSEVAAQLPQSEGKVLAWGKSLMATGLEGERLNKAVKAVASSAALMGNDGGAAEGLIKRFQMLEESGGKVKLDRRIMAQLAEAGVSAKTLAAELGVDASRLSTMSLDAGKMGDALQNALITKGKKSLDTMGLTWDSIKGKLSDGIGDLFEDMGTAVAPFMATVKDLFSEFTAGSTTMGGVKSVLTAVFTEVFAVAAKLVNYLHQGFLYLEIGALHVAIALTPIGRKFREIASNQTMIDGFTIVMKGLGIVLLILAGAAAVFGGTIVAIGAAFGFVAGIALAAVGAVVGGIAWLMGALENAAPAIKLAIMQWADSANIAAQNFVNGLVNGIVSGVGSVVAAVKGLATAAAGAFTGFFKIHSPSRLMYEYGLMLPAGAVGGVEDGTDDVVAAVGGMSQASAAAAVPGGAGSKSSGGNTFHIVNHFNGVGEDVVEKIQTTFREMLEVARGESATAVPT